MLTHLVAALLQLAAQPATPAAPPGVAARADTVADTSATVAGRRRPRPKRVPKRIEVTPQHFATAFENPAARALLTLARETRMRQDSALQSYDATTYQRVSVGMALSRIGPERLAFRNEQATHVRWRRGIGAYVDVTGSRSVVPIAGKSAHVALNGNISPIPYYPGSETLWIGQEAARQAVDENEGIIHPLASGSEAYYTYATGDSATFRLPDGRSIRLRELRVRPRTPRWNLAVGSLWFDLSGGQLVRAAYRMSVPMDIVAVSKDDDPKAFDDVPAYIKPLLFPMTAQVSAIGVEYGLYQGRFWLPRLQVLEGGAHVSLMRVPFKLEQKFQYENVNSGATLPPIAVAVRDTATSGMSVTVGSQSKADSTRRAGRVARRKQQCDSTGAYTYTRTSESNPNPVLVVMTCDTLKLANSPELPPSIYDATDETMGGGAEIEALVSQALSMGAQSAFAPQLPVVALDRPRYNRVEGLSLGARVDQQLGAGYSAHALGRIGLADREPNVELTGARSDLRRTISVTAYNRLVAANDWGNPLSTGSSLSALLFGRDEGFYYRASGLELGSAPDEPSTGSMTWSVFAEQERTARQRTTFSLARAVRGSEFVPNVESVRGTYVGARTRLTRTLGLDPQGFRLFSDLRLETAHGDTGTFGRGALDLTASHGIGNGAAALTLAAGSSLGPVPTQRYWFLGGTQTVRGETAGTERGNAFWMARGELAHGLGAVRPVLFGDIGWAGDRSNWSKVGVPMSGAGIGMSLLDGLIRTDISRGINPVRQWRFDAYVEGRF